MTQLILHAIWLLNDRMKIHQILHVKLESETTSQFFFKLRITLQCHERQLFCTFLVETLYDLCKRSPAKSKVSDCSCEISSSLYFDRLLLLKLYKISAEIAQRSCIYFLTLKSDKKFEEKSIYCFKKDKNLVNFNRSTQKSKKIGIWLVPFI